MRPRNLQVSLLLGAAMLVAVLFLRDRRAPTVHDSIRRSDSLVLRHPLRVPLYVGSQTIDELASKTRPTLSADEGGDWESAGAPRHTGPHLAPEYRPLDEEWSADHSRTNSGSIPDQVARRLIPTPTWSPEPQRVREHRVAEGDTLKRIAERYLGDSERWLELFTYNRRVLANPEVLPSGTLLRLPPREGPEASRSADDWHVDLVPLN